MKLTFKSQSNRTSTVPLRSLTNTLFMLLAVLCSVFTSGHLSAAPFEIEGTIKELRKIETKPPYTFENKAVVSVHVVGLRFGKDFDYQYMVVEGTSVLEGIAFSGLKQGAYVRIKSRAEPPGMVGKPINEIRASRYGCCNYALHVDTVATPRNITASIVRVDSFGPTDRVITVREAAPGTAEFKYLVVEGKTTFGQGVFADLAVGRRITIAQASINVPVPPGKDHGRLHGADLFAAGLTLLSASRN